MPNIGDRLQHAWNAFMGRDPTPPQTYSVSYGSIRPDRTYLSYRSDKSIVTTVYNRIAIDAAAIDIRHVKLDENGSYVETIKSGLNNVLSVEANLDQTGRAFVQDIVESMCSEGIVAVVPIDTDLNPNQTGGFDILTARVAKIVQWFPEHIKVLVYNEKTGKKEEIIVPKKMVSIIENPLASVMNEPNSTLQRLIRTLNNLDAVNQQASSGKLDLIIQLPYIIKTEERRKQAENRRKDIEAQLTGTKYGIAYSDGTERITQLNRPVENNLWNQAKELTDMLFNQLGLSKAVFDGTADERVMLNYYSRTIEPILSAITDEMKRKFLTKTARTQKQSIEFYRDPFKLVPVNDLANIVSVFTQNEILSSNEVRSIIGYKPSDSARADELVNKSINPTAMGEPEMPMEEEEVTDENSAYLDDDNDDVMQMIDQLLAEIEEDGNA